MLVSLLVIIALVIVACRLIRNGWYLAAVPLLIGATVILGANLAPGRAYGALDWLAVCAFWALPAFALRQRLLAR